MKLLLLSVFILISLLSIEGQSSKKSKFPDFSSINLSKSSAQNLKAVPEKLRELFDTDFVRDHLLYKAASFFGERFIAHAKNKFSQKTPRVPIFPDLPEFVCYNATVRQGTFPVEEGEDYWSELDIVDYLWTDNRLFGLNALDDNLEFKLLPGGELGLEWLANSPALESDGDRLFTMMFAGHSANLTDEIGLAIGSLNAFLTWENTSFDLTCRGKFMPANETMSVTNATLIFESESFEWWAFWLLGAYIDVNDEPYWVPSVVEYGDMGPYVLELIQYNLEQPYIRSALTCFIDFFLNNCTLEMVLDGNFTCFKPNFQDSGCLLQPNTTSSTSFVYNNDLFGLEPLTYRECAPRPIPETCREEGAYNLKFPGDYSKYYECINKVATVKKCDKNLIYDESRKSCTESMGLKKTHKFPDMKGNFDVAKFSKNELKQVPEYLNKIFGNEAVTGHLLNKFATFFAQRMIAHAKTSFSPNSARIPIFPDLPEFACTNATIRKGTFPVIEGEDVYTELDIVDYLWTDNRIFGLNALEDDLEFKLLPGGELGLQWLATSPALESDGDRLFTMMFAGHSQNYTDEIGMALASLNALLTWENTTFDLICRGTFMPTNESISITNSTLKFNTNNFEYWAFWMIAGFFDIDDVPTWNPTVVEYGDLGPFVLQLIDHNLNQPYIQQALTCFIDHFLNDCNLDMLLSGNFTCFKVNFQDSNCLVQPPAPSSSSSSFIYNENFLGLEPLTYRECPAPIVEEICVDEGVYRLPYPGECDMYYQCINYVHTVETCSQNLFYDHSIQECNRWDLVDCPWFTSTTKSPLCPEEGVVYQPVPGDCQAYILCADGVPHEQRCPGGTLFDPVDLRCKLEDEVDCEAGKSLKN